MATVPLGSRRRVRYLIGRARSLDIGNVWRLAGLARRTSRIPRPVVAIDMLWCSVRYEVAFQDYADWDFHLLRRSERTTWMTHPKSNHLALRLNSREHRSTFADKTRFDARFSDYLHREWLDVRETDAAGVAAFLARHGEVIAKVPDSLGGKGISRVTVSEAGDAGAFRERLLADRQFLLEEVLPQHSAMAALNPTSVNTLRLITYRDPSGTVHHLAAVLKIGNGGPVDNFSHGGMYTMVDDDGVARFPAFDGAGDTFAVHPATGEPIVGFRVPLFADAREFVERLAGEVPEMPYIGWDVAITPDGPAVIEGNYNTGVFQSKPSVSGVRIGLLPRYRESIGF